MAIPPAQKLKSLRLDESLIILMDPLKLFIPRRPQGLALTDPLPPPTMALHFSMPGVT